MVAELTAEEKAKNVVKWANALWSEKYKQGAGRLGDEDGYCCLGVGCMVTKTPFRSDQGCSIGFQKRAGLMDTIGTLQNRVSLIQLNDERGYSFPKIADHIWKNKAELFVPEVAKALNQYETVG